MPNCDHVRMNPRAIDVERDLRAVADLLGRTRTSGGEWHPGGIQWWLRDLWLQRDGFEAFVVDGDDNSLRGFVLFDDTFVVAEHEAGQSAVRNLVGWAEGHLLAGGKSELSTQAVEDSELERDLLGDGYTPSSFGYELMIDTSEADEDVALPEPYRFVSLLDISDEAYIDGHRAAWSDTRPSPYRRELHDAVKKMPQFRPDLATIALAPDGTVASYCMGWLDEQSGTLEIEPLGTHRDHRRKGLAHAVVREVIRRAASNGARDVLVWNEPPRNQPAYFLYTTAGMRPARKFIELTKQLLTRPSTGDPSSAAPAGSAAPGAPG